MKDGLGEVAFHTGRGGGIIELRTGAWRWWRIGATADLRHRCRRLARCALHPREGCLHLLRPRRVPGGDDVNADALICHRYPLLLITAVLLITRISSQ